uniref:PCI domain-containing protein n=1 Tax=Chenopodium quinoa TaxID=63459 RepID=A0A803MDF1_CHEQI
MAYISMGEAHRRITDYLNSYSDAIATQNGPLLRRLLSFSSNNPKLLSVADALNIFQDVSRLIRQSHETLVPLLRSLQCYKLGQLVDAYNSYEKFANAFIQEFRNWESAWALEALYVVAYEIRIIAERADRELASNGKTPDKLKAAGSFLMKVFGVLAGKGPKRVGALHVTCQLFKIYFKLGTVHLCRSVIRSIETARIFDFEEFPPRDKADEKLSYALAHCHPDHAANIRDVVLALRRGDLRLLRCALQEHEDRFLRSGVYLVLEKLELQVYRRLLKKIYTIQKQKDPSKAHQVKLDIIVKALKWLQIDMDLDEVECIVAILIHKNLIKGYFAHKSKVVVLSKQDPFPKLMGKPVGL